MNKGWLYALLAGAIWGVVIMAPSLVPEFSPVLLSCARFGLYGLFSLLVSLPYLPRLWRQVNRHDLWLLARLALAGNLVNYALLAAAVQLAGVTTAALVNGVLPLAIAWLGRRELGALTLSRLAGPLCLVIAGVLAINLSHGPGLAFGRQQLLGIACGLAALAAWGWYAVANARYLKQSQLSSQQWATLGGLVTGAIAITAGGLLYVLLPRAIIPEGLGVERWQTFLWVALGLAVFGSWLANSLWNACTRRMAVTLSGQLIVFETLFACAYGFAQAQRLPTVLEASAISALTLGVLWAARLHRAPVAAPA